MAVIAITSGKGGVGKTTVSANLAVALSAFADVAVVDCDFVLPNLHLQFGVDNPPVSLLDVISGNNTEEGPLYKLKVRVGKYISSLIFVPSLSPPHLLKSFDDERFREYIGYLESNFDIVVLDVSAGLSRLSLIPLRSADQIYLVTNPDPISVSTALKVITVLHELDKSKKGLIFNRYNGEQEIVRNVSTTFDLEISGIIRESRLIPESWEKGVPVVSYKPKSGVAKDFIAMAEKILGIRKNINAYRKLRLKLDW